MFFSGNGDQLEIGVDEAGRGCMAGPVCAGAVVWNPGVSSSDIKDSKKMSAKKREVVAEYIYKNATACGVGVAWQNEIDSTNIEKATHLAMHRAIDEVVQKLAVPEAEIIDKLLLVVDGNRFTPYLTSVGFISHECVVKADDKFVGVSAASILAKVKHDQLVRDYCTREKIFSEQYGWLSNMCYGTKKHMDAIRLYGATPFHRRSFGICKTIHDNRG